LTVFLRILTAAELTKNQSFYGNFLEAIDMTEFIKTEVEPMGKEADHLQIIALSTALNVGIKVVHMDRGDGVVVHTFPEEGIENYDVVLLYRPGHYDVIYE
jgi:ubiquitin thioesterase protein OTUB1